MNNTLSNGKLVDRFSRMSKLTAWIVTTIGCLVVVGWLFNIELLQRLVPGFPTMKFNTALGFVFAGVGLLSIKRRPTVARVTAIFILLIGLFTLAEYIFGWNLGIDQLLVKESANSQNLFPGRMSPVTALNFCLIGICLWIIIRHDKQTIGQWLALVVSFISLVSFAGYLYNAQSLYQISIFSAMSLHTTITFMFLSLGIFLSESAQGLAAIITMNRAGGFLARRLLPSIVIIPLVAGWIRLKGQQAGLYDTNFGLALFAVSNIILVSTLIIWAARTLNLIDAKREQATDAIREANQELEKRVQERTIELTETNQKLQREISERKYSQTIYKTLVEHLPDMAVMMFDREMRYSIADGPILRTTGYSQEQMLGKTIFEVLPPASQEVLEPLYQRALNGEYFQIERQSGGLYYRSSFVPVYDSSGSVTNGLIAIQDITAYKRTEEALKNNEEKLETIFNLLPVGASLINSDKRIVQMNLALEKILDMNMPDLLQGKYRSRRYIHSDGTPMLPSEFPSEQALVEQRSVSDMEIGVIKEDGSTIWTNVSAAPLPRNQGVVVVTSDISARKRVEEQLRTSEEQFRSTFAYAAIGMALVGLDGRWLRVNAALCEYIGYTEQELFSKTFQDITHPDDLDSDLHNVTQLLQGKIQSYQMEKRYFHKLGHIVWVLLSVSLVRDSQSNPLYFVSQIQNITDRKYAEQALNTQLSEESEFRKRLQSLHDITIELTLIDDLDTFYKRAIELGLERLGYERLGLLLFDKIHNTATGTYGTDMHGNMQAEYHLRFDQDHMTDIVKRALTEAGRFVLDDDAQLFANLDPIGKGWNAIAVLWNGNENTGWLSADNAIHHKPVSKAMLDTLSLYAMTLGTLLAQKQTRLALKESEFRFRSAITNAPFPIMIHAEGGEILNLSRMWSELSGYSHDDIPTMGDWTEKAYGERRTVVQEVIDSVYSREEPLKGGEFKVRTKTGEIRIWDFVAAPVGRLPDGRRMISSMAMDITERKQAEEALAANEALIRTVLDNLPVGVWIIGPTGDIVQANPMGQQIWAGVKYVGIDQYGQYKGWWYDTGKLIQPEEWGAARAIAKGQTSLAEEVEIECFDGTRKYILHSAVPMLDSHKNIVGAVVVNQDITNMKQTEIDLQKTNDELEQANEEVKRFAYIVSHDLRAPLINLKGFSDMLRTSVNQIDKLSETIVTCLDEPQRKVYNDAIHERIPTALRFINTSVDRMDGFTSAILKLSRLGHNRLSYDNVSVKDIVDHILQSLAAQIADQAIEITVDDLPEIRADRVALDQIMGNIITNATKYLDPNRKGQIHIFSESDDVKTTFHVKDNGRGIAEIDYDKVFAPFRRAGRPTVEGEGMGLAYVQTLIKRHRGKIWFTSTLDVGTTFSFSIPHEIEEKL